MPGIIALHNIIIMPFLKSNNDLLKIKILE
jgi:hypothetical protein